MLINFMIINILCLLIFKNAYDKVVHDKLFIKLSNYGINKEIINAIKIIYSNAKNFF